MGWTHFVLLARQWVSVYRRFFKKAPRSVGPLLYQNQPSYFRASTVYLRHFPLGKKCLKNALLLQVWSNKQIDEKPCRNFSAKDRKPQHLRGRQNNTKTLGLDFLREIPRTRGHISLRKRVLWSSGMENLTRFAGCWQDNSTWIFSRPWLRVILRNQCHLTCFSKFLITLMSDNQGTEAWV